MNESQIASPAQTEPSIELLDAARRVAAIADADAEAAEAQYYLTDRTVAAMRESGLLKMWVPRALGGLEADPITSICVLEAVSRADGAAGWTLMAADVAIGSAAAYLADAAVAAVFGRGDDPVIAGQGSANGRGVPEAGGYRLSGHWSYGSGIAHAAWAHSGFLVVDDGETRRDADGRAQMLISIVPMASVTLAGNWDVIGLRATGSFDYKMSDVFVPQEFTHRFDTREPLRGGVLYRLGISGLAQLCHTSFALGNARRALDEVGALAPAKRLRAGGLLGEEPSFQERYALAEAQLAAARAYVLETWNDAWHTLRSGDPLSLKQWALLSLATRHTHDVASEVVNFAYRAGGGTSLRASVLQRTARDMHAATQHVIINDQATRHASTVLLGMAPEGARWSGTGLI
jgi:alkylation response protein AidB-like acyl-CoA dehydrogenase